MIKNLSKKAMEYSINDIVKIVNGQLKAQRPTAELVHSLCTDSRKVRNAHQSIFVPLLTDIRDGHRYISSAYKQGVRSFFYSNASFEVGDFPQADFILVADTLRAMQDLVADHRTHFQIPVIGITGSNGKTIVKEWLSQLLSHKEQVVKNPKSYNSQIGVPISVSNMQALNTIGIFEAGISLPNEMIFLQKIIQPTDGIFTMIGAAHDANFSSVQEKIREKLLLFAKCKKLFYCSNHVAIEREVRNYLIPLNPDIEIRTWGKDVKSNLCICKTQKGGTNTIITATYINKDIVLSIPFTDFGYIENAMHCWLVLLEMGYAHDEIKLWFQQLPPVQMRLEVLKGINNCTLINDTYSSDLASLSIGLDFLQEQHQHNKHSVILSDILDHGNSERIYNDVIDLLKERSMHRIILIGSETGKLLSTFSNKLKCELIHFADTESFLKEIDVQIFNDEAILIKGARQYSLERIVNRLEEHIHRTVMNINLSALIHNVNVFKKKLPTHTKIMAMVKAFSYGAGTYEIASALEHHGVDYLAVAYVDEGILLRKKGIQLPILVLNPEVSSLDAMLHYNLEPEVYSVNLLEQFARRLVGSDNKLPIHIKLETGMHRLGVDEKDLETFLEIYKSANCFEVKSVFSHLVGSDDEILADFTLQQKKRFEQLSARIETSIGYTVIKHLTNSGGALRNNNLAFDMVRLGIGLYGIDSNPQIQQELQQISTLKSSISQLKKLCKNETVGYGRVGVLQRDSIIATINIGYADGYARAFSKGKGKVLIHGHLAPIIGNICMDMMMVDVTDIPMVAEGDDVVIFGPELSVSQLASWIDTIPYEIISGISQRVKRVFYRE